jgi:hypothetical protein
MASDHPTQQRRFPAPWVAEPIPGGFIVKDANGITVAWVYSRDDLVRNTGGHGWLTSDEARRIAAGIARLPALIGGAVKGGESA